MSFATSEAQQQIGDYIQTAAAALYIFECVITFSQEVDVIWRRKWTMATWLYACTRYTALLYSILTMISVSTYTSCVIFLYTVDVLQLAQFLCFALFAAIRVYAFLGGKALISCVIFALNMAPFAGTIYDYATSVIFMNAFTCTPISTLSAGILLRLSITSRIAVISADVFVILITWRETLEIYRDAFQFRTSVPLVTLLLRDGTLHFIVLMVLNILQLLSLNAPSLFFLDLGDPFLSTLGPVIICRFILNLRYVDAVENSCPSTIRQSASLRFTGDMGQLLSIGEDQENDDDDDGRFIRNGGLDNIAVAIDVIEDSVRVPGEHSSV